MTTWLTRTGIQLTVVFLLQKLIHCRSQSMSTPFESGDDEKNRTLRRRIFFQALVFVAGADPGLF